MRTTGKLALAGITVLIFLAAGAIGAWLAFDAAETSDQDGSAKDAQTDPTDKPTGAATVSPVDLANPDLRSDEYVYDGKAPIYVSVYSHNEDSWEGLVNTAAKYRSYRAGLVERADLLRSYDIPWDWQSDQPVIEAMIENEDDVDLLAATDGQNVLQYLESNGASIDPHAHTNNYADIAYLVERLGIQASGVIGGTVVNECGGNVLGFYDLAGWHKNVDIQDDGYVHGEDYPDALWKPTVLSDPGMGGHWFDDWSSGVWLPGDAEDFFVHDPNNEIVYIGEGYPHDASIIGPTHASGSIVHNADGQYIRELAEKIADNELPTGTKAGQRFMYTASIHMRDTDVVTDGDTPTNTAEGLGRVLDELQPLRDAGKIIFVDFETAAETWRSKYGSVPWRIDLSTFSFYDEILEQGESYCSRNTERTRRTVPPTNETPR